MPKPTIHYDKVKDTRVLDEIMDICPTDVFAKEEGKIIVKRPNECIGCKSCENISENGEVTIEN